MKYAIWFVRLVFVAWMLPAGVNHFIPLFPQPLGNMPLSRELFAALDASDLFTLVKGVELLAAICLLTGYFVPLGLLLCMPVSFCVWYWDVPLQGWGSVSAIYGWAVLVTNTLLCLAYLPSYAAMLAPLARPKKPGRNSMTRDWTSLIVAGRLLFGALLVASGVNHFFLPFFPLPAGHQPLAVQLMSALTHSQLLDVVMGMQLVAGGLILIGLFVPLALCVIMPVSICAAYWAVLLEHDPLWSAIALAAAAVNALLLLAYIDFYKSFLQPQAVALGEGSAPYEALFVRAGGRTARGAFAAALVPLALAALFYHFLVWGRTGEWAMLVFLFPAIAVHARRLHDMGWTAWLLVIPAVPIAAAVWLYMFDRTAGQATPAIWTALVISGLFTAWGLMGRSRLDVSRYGAAGR